MLLDEERGVLFAGDTLRYDGVRVSSAPEEYTLDMARMRDSIVMASKLRFDVMLPGHGLPLTSNASIEIRKLLARL
jgi:glyoxylase-like metal-dependent hydrolase (beta-lactamase superfamily II)